MRRLLLITLALLATSATLTTTAEAQRRRGTGRMADAWQQRPLTLPKATLRFDIHEDDWDPSWGGFKFRSIERPGPDDRLNSAFFNFGMSGGVLDDLELGALLVPLRLAPSGDYLNPQFYVLWRFLRGPVQIGLEGRVDLPADHDGWGQFGVPFLISAGSLLRMDFGFFLRTDFDGAAFMFPFRLGFQISLPFFLGLDTGVFVGDRFGLVDDDVDVPLGMFFGYSIFASGNPLVDLMWGFRTLDIERDAVDIFEVWFSARFHVFL